ncbi:PHP domain-containing protein [Demetria terragena]|uniref:PHP domain-containing protein n=1 Tax=Demetria terragena TaxID=63959 RepID=UPI00036CA065|nr:PHP domain-containing protein [Demetria terragena]
MRIDLHTHSTASDGTQSPAEVIRSASEAGLDVVALTDHDSTRGWAAAEEAARSLGIAVVPGIEISCAIRNISVHLLAYLHDPSDAALLSESEHARASRTTRARRMVELLAQDYPITWADVQAQVVDDTTLGRPHIADALVARGIVRDRNEAFVDLLHSRGAYHVPHYAPDPVTAVRLVRAAGGVPILAHPFAEQRGRVVDDADIEAMIQAGLAGLEVDHRDHDPAARRHAADLAQAWGVLATGSSDYHGAGKDNRLGENLTEPVVLEQIEDQATGPITVIRS